MWAVLLTESRGDFAYGPFEEKPLATRFADFLTAEVDPARVVPLDEVGPARPVTWRSPLIELLNWRDFITTRDVTR